MARALVYGAILALAAFIGITVFVLNRGGGASQAVMQVSVHDLSAAPQAYTGEHVTTSGVLRRVAEPEEHFLVTAEGLGVVIRGYNPEVLRSLEGRAVVVTGRFGADGTEGTYIEAESVEPSP